MEGQMNGETKSETVGDMAERWKEGVEDIREGS